MTDTGTRTCAERLPEHLSGRLDDFRAMLDRPDPEEMTNPDDYNEPGPLSEYPLGASVRYLVRVDLSTGGPADYLTAEVDAGGGWRRIVYHFADWFDHAERSLVDEEYDTAERFIEALYGDELAYHLAVEMGDSAPERLR